MNCKIVKHLGPEPKKIPLDTKRRGKSALITGASSGLGRELAILFSQGNHVILSGRNQRELEETQRQCKDPGNTTIICGDLRNTGTINVLSSFADLYEIRYLICCAGEYTRGPFQLFNPTGTSTLDAFHSNATATIELIGLMWPVLVRTHGRIIHINSIAGKNLSPEEAIYSASKHAMKGFLQAFRFEARDHGVRVLDVFPGAIQTPMCKDRPGYDKMMDVRDTAYTIFTAATMDLPTAQIEELHIGRFRI